MTTSGQAPGPQDRSPAGDAPASPLPDTRVHEHPPGAHLVGPLPLPDTRIHVVGLGPEGLPAAGWRPGLEALVAQARLVAGGERHLGAAGIDLADPRAVVLRGDLRDALARIEAEEGLVCVLASGDPGFFGIGRLLAERLGSRRLAVHPAPSSVSVAFARLGLPWDAAAVVSAHARPLGDAARAVAGALAARPDGLAGRELVAVLCGPEAPPELVGVALRELHARVGWAAVLSELGQATEAVVTTDLDGLCGGQFEQRSVVILGASSTAPARSLAWGLPEGTFEHRDGMVTKAEVRAVVLGKLALPASGVLWDLGAGSASVAIECARLQPALRVLALERDPLQVGLATANAASHGVRLEVLRGEAPAALADLPDPDRVFVGGGGIAVLDAALARLRAGGIVVATFAALERAAAAAERLGELVEVQVARGQRLAQGGWRLRASNPVFVAWGRRA